MLEFFNGMYGLYTKRRMRAVGDGVCSADNSSTAT